MQALEKNKRSKYVISKHQKYSSDLFEVYAIETSIKNNKLKGSSN